MSYFHERPNTDPMLPAIHDVTVTMGTDQLPHSQQQHAAGEKVAGYATIEAQQQYLDVAMDQAARIEYAQRVVRGPQHAAFNGILQGINASLRQISPTLTPDYLVPPAYQERATAAVMRTQPAIEIAVNRLRAERLQRLKLQGGHGLISLLHQELPRDLLDVPDYHRQGEFVTTEQAKMLCVNACFRMVHDGIAGWAPPEDLLAARIKDRHNDTIVEDEEYYKLFQTQAFKEATGQTVKMVEVLGADFETINKLTHKIKERHPAAKVFAVASLSSQTAFHEDTWHSVVLLHKSGDEVVCHDPGVEVGRSYKHMSITDFARRWAIAYNRVQLAIAL